MKTLIAVTATLALSGCVLTAATVREVAEKEVDVATDIAVDAKEFLQELRDDADAGIKKIDAAGQ